VNVPLLAPTVIAVAAPPILTVVALVLTNANVPVVGVVMLVVMSGLVKEGVLPRTKAPEPVTVAAPSNVVTHVSAPVEAAVNTTQLVKSKPLVRRQCVTCAQTNDWLSG
jgi:hypothetical protein